MTARAKDKPLVDHLGRALELAVSDLRRAGADYGPQSVIMTALRRWKREQDAAAERVVDRHLMRGPR